MGTSVLSNFSLKLTGVFRKAIDVPDWTEMDNDTTDGNFSTRRGYFPDDKRMNNSWYQAMALRRWGSLEGAWRSCYQTTWQDER